MNDIKRRSHNLRSNIKTPLVPGGDFANRGKNSINHSPGIGRSKDKTIRDIDEKVEIFKNRITDTPTNTPIKPSPRVDNIRHDFDMNFKKGRRNNRFIKIFLWLIIIIGIIFSLLTFVFDRSYLYILPKSINYTINNTFNLQVPLNNNSLKDINNNIQIIQITKSSNVKISKSEPQNVQIKATGKMLIYNNYSSDPVKLIKNTRFQTDNGNIYRIANNIIIPGKTGDNPGSASVDIVADNIGPDYNINNNQKLTVVNFKNTPKYLSVYGQINTPITGGFSGTQYAIAKEDVDKNNQLLQTKITNDINAELLKTKRDAFVIATDTLQIVWSNNLTAYQSNQADNYILTGTAYIILIKDSILANLIGHKIINNYNNENVYLSNNNLKINYIDKTLLSDLYNSQNNNNINISLTGNFRLTYSIDQDKIKSTIAGKTNDAAIIQDLLFKNNTLNTVTVKLFPIWLNSFPKDTSKIVINIDDK